MPNNLNILQQLIQSTMQQPSQKLQINDLLAGLNQEEVPEFLHQVYKDSNKKVETLSKKKHDLLKRELSYQMTKQQMDKWVPIVKINREKSTLNLVQKPIQDTNVDFFAAKPINKFHQKIESKLQQMKVGSQKAVLRHQQKILEKVEPDEAKRRLIEARKHRTAIFYEEIKRRRISKIKSKMYHRIKKRQKMREQAKRMEEMHPTERTEYIEKLTKRRIKQRITLRHSSKNKHIKSITRFHRNEKNDLQSSINNVNEMRKKHMERIDNEMIGQSGSEEYDENNFKQAAMRDLQAEISALENEGKHGQDSALNDMKFIQLAKQKRLNAEKKQAKKLLKKLAEGEKEINEEDLEDEEENSNSESNDKINITINRKTYGENINMRKNVETGVSNKGIQHQIDKYLLTMEHGEELTQGINLQKLKDKYQPERVEVDLANLISDHKEIYEGENQAVLENVREFQQEKLADYEQQIEPPNKHLQGWGSWTGPGIKQQKADPQLQLRKKLAKISELKKKRKDSSMAHVTINESQNRNLTDYLVRNLPHNYGNAQQFDFMQNEPVGPEWNSFNQFKDNIKPKIQTKIGQVITPAKMPTKLEKHVLGGYNAKK